MSSGLILDDIIMNLFSYITEQKKGLGEKIFIFQNRGWLNLLVPRISSGLFMKNCWYQKDITYTSFHWKIEITKIYLWFVICSYWWGTITNIFNVPDKFITVKRIILMTEIWIFSAEHIESFVYLFSSWSRKKTIDNSIHPNMIIIFVHFKRNPP